jgi:hypothetical protein
MAYENGETYLLISAIIYNRYNNNNYNNNSSQYLYRQQETVNEIMLNASIQNPLFQLRYFQPTELKKLHFIKCLMPEAGTGVFCFGVTRCHLRTVRLKLCKVLTLNVP